jgi:O-antigen/teichoic acid export membrane protein
MGPFFVVLMGISQVAIPEASRAFQRSPGRLTRFCLALGGAQATAVLAWGLALVVVLPLGPGRLLLDDLWSGTRPLVPAVTLNVAAACFLTAATAGLRAMGVARRSLRVQLITATAYVIFSTVGAALGGALGACWGAMAANSLGAVVAWHHLSSALAEHEAAITGSGPPPR